MRFLRSLAFSLGMIVATLIFAPPSVLSFPFSYRARYRFIIQWCHFNIWWLGVTCNLRYRVTGLENIPDTPCIVLSKHQSTWETLALNLFFHPQVWVLKKELLWVPFFGWGLAMLDPIAINRGAGRDAMGQVLEQGAERLQRGCWVVIYPEGTRTPAGTRRRYKPGGARLAVHTGTPIIPVAHNAGDYWARRTFTKTPGVIDLSIGPPITPDGSSAQILNARAEAWIEAEVARLRGTEVPSAP
ncbi:MAG: 1-acyl-sn-glycerol-3-phosphate acyltransferase [Chromatiales bacterium]|jgi:1-acyl-sn-glycerol-3-phosphate acyltransferase|nr:1-acyl-sn-glycerol-3-phosphate acyltransferase [Chromatiales bacterium]